jgi:excisionase family DNA binding protein
VGERNTTSRAGSDPTANQRQRLTVHDAARQLGVSEDAVRMRIKRGTLSSEKVEGRLYVYLTPEPKVDRTDELIEELRARTLSLEHQLEAEREANRENRRIIAALTSRIPAIEAPQEAPGGHETAGEDTGGAEPRPSRKGPQEGAQSPWWRRMFGGSSP